MRREKKDMKVACITTIDNKLSMGDIEIKLRECFDNIVVINSFFLTTDNVQEVWAEVQNHTFILIDSELIKNKKWWEFIEKIGGKEALGNFGVSDTDYLLSV